MRATREQYHFARIMAEGGCTIEDIALTLGVSTWDVAAAAGDTLMRRRPTRREMTRMLATLEAARGWANAPVDSHHPRYPHGDTEVTREYIVSKSQPSISRRAA